jgi:hypothetical protein
MSIVAIACGKCGIDYGVAEARYEELRETGETFYCPNGHPRVFREGPKDKRIRELEAQVAKVHRDNSQRFRDLIETRDEALGALVGCPLCGDRVARANYRLETIRAKLVEHLQDEHGARQRLRAIPEKASEGNALP